MPETDPHLGNLEHLRRHFPSAVIVGESGGWLDRTFGPDDGSAIALRSIQAVYQPVMLPVEVDPDVMFGDGFADAESCFVRRVSE